MSTENTACTEETSKPAKAKLRKYHLLSVEKTDAPKGQAGSNWHHYVIGQGSAKIEGYRPGSLKSVTEHAETVVTDLNARTASGKSTYAVSKKK